MDQPIMTIPPIPPDSSTTSEEAEEKSKELPFLRTRLGLWTVTAVICAAILILMQLPRYNFEQNRKATLATAYAGAAKLGRPDNYRARPPIYVTLLENGHVIATDSAVKGLTCDVSAVGTMIGFTCDGPVPYADTLSFGPSTESQAVKPTDSAHIATSATMVAAITKLRLPKAVAPKPPIYARLVEKGHAQATDSAVPNLTCDARDVGAKVSVICTGPSPRADTISVDFKKDSAKPASTHKEK